MNRRLFSLLLLAALSLRPAQAPPGPPAGVAATVDRVVDGDTISCTAGGKVVHVRMLGIDSCEIGQGSPGLTARDWLSLSLPPGTAVTLVLDSHRPRDLYGRTLAWVSVAGDVEPVNVQAVRQGMAFAYRPSGHAVDNWAALVGAEVEARGEHRGIWAAGPDGVQRPWEWRKRKRSGPGR